MLNDKEDFENRDKSRRREKLQKDYEYKKGKKFIKKRRRRSFSNHDEEMDFSWD